MTVHRGRRWSAANAYLRPALRRPNLELRTHCLAARVLFDGRRATGVAYRRGGAEHVGRARREVILCGGPVNTPQLLELSGVGRPAEMARHGIAPVHARAGVGENLQDHLEFYFQFACTQPITLYSSLGPLAKLRIGLRWLLAWQQFAALLPFIAALQRYWMKIATQLKIRNDWSSPTIVHC